MTTKILHSGTKSSGWLRYCLQMTKACFKRRILHASNSIVSIMLMLSATSETIKFDVSNCVDLNLKFDRPGRIMHAKFDVVSDVAFCMHRIQLIYPFYRLLSSSLRTGNYFAHKTSCNAYKCDEIGHMFSYSAPMPPKI